MAKEAKPRSARPTQRVADRRRVADADAPIEEEAKIEPRQDIDLRAGGITWVVLGEPPDWEMWQSMPTAQLWEAVALSLNIAPVEKVREHYLHDHDSGYPKRLRIAESHIAEGTALRLISGELGTPSATVRLLEFGAWARTMGWELPAEFPRDAQKSTLAPTTEATPARGLRTQEEAPVKPAQLHKIGRHVLSPALQAAQLAAAELPGFRLGDVGQVWTQLLAMARKDTRPHPLAGVAPDGVLYHCGNGLMTFTRKMLADRMRRAKARSGA